MIFFIEISILRNSVICDLVALSCANKIFYYTIHVLLLNLLNFFFLCSDETCDIIIDERFSYLSYDRSLYLILPNYFSNIHQRYLFCILYSYWRLHEARTFWWWKEEDEYSLRITHESIVNATWCKFLLYFFCKLRMS